MRRFPTFSSESIHGGTENGHFNLVCTEFGGNTHKRSGNNVDSYKLPIITKSIDESCYK